MLLFSVALHLGVGVGALFPYSYRTSPAKPKPLLSETATLVLLPDVVSIDVPTVSTTQPPGRIKATAQPMIAPPSPEIPAPEISTALPVAAKPHAAIALEANPNAHLRAPQLDPILAPNPPPQLNNHDGVVFLLDVSGSMYEPFAGATRLAFARETISLSIRALKDGTPFAITIYGQTAHNSGPLVAASNATRDAAIRYIMQDYDCGGGTNLPDGLASAQGLHSGRILLVTDGDLNIAPVDLLVFAHRVLGMPGQGPALTVIGISPRPNTRDLALLKGLAEQQGGTYVASEITDASVIVSR
jgi:hypothetical protein